MEKTLNVAKKMYDMYFEKYKKNMDEMKMHKLMYFAQRESLMYNNEKLFKADFYGWKYGPVLKSVRSQYMGKRFKLVQSDVSDKTVALLDKVLDRYGNLSSWQLSNLSHGELSWKQARRNLKPDVNGDTKLSLNAMRLDAAKELAYRNRG